MNLNNNNNNNNNHHHHHHQLVYNNNNNQLALVIANFRAQYGQYFPSFSNFADLKAKYEKRRKYWPYCAR